MKFDLGLALKRWGVGTILSAAIMAGGAALVTQLQGGSIDWKLVGAAALGGLLSAAKTDHAAFTEAVKTDAATTSQV
jgi:hypothetical protein